MNWEAQLSILWEVRGSTERQLILLLKKGLKVSLIVK